MHRAVPGNRHPVCLCYLCYEVIHSGDCDFGFDFLYDGGGGDEADDGDADDVAHDCGVSRPFHLPRQIGADVDVGVDDSSCHDHAAVDPGRRAYLSLYACHFSAPFSSSDPASSAFPPALFQSLRGP